MPPGNVLGLSTDSYCSNTTNCVSLTLSSTDEKFWNKADQTKANPGLRHSKKNIFLNLYDCKKNTTFWNCVGEKLICLPFGRVSRKKSLEQTITHAVDST